jgi:hypothetical protein
MKKEKMTMKMLGDDENEDDGGNMVMIKKMKMTIIW